MTTDTPLPSEGPPTLQKFLACVAMAVGALMVGLCGLCTARVLGPFLWGTGGEQGSGSMFLLALGIALAIDAIPVTIGIIIFRAGLRNYRK